MQVDPSSVSRWATGERRIPAHHVRKLADVLEIEASVLEVWTKERR
jgi:DNA-binding transcriptional regulator YdaS (Cro superfamily)